MNSDTGLGSAFKSVEAEMRRVTLKLKRDAELQATEFAKKSVKELRAEIQTSLEEILTAFKGLEHELGISQQELSVALEKKLNDLRTASAQFRLANGQDFKALAEEIGSLKAEIKEIGDRKVVIPDFATEINGLRTELENMLLANQSFSEDNDTKHDQQINGLTKKLEDLEETLKKLRSSIATVSHGGNANRNILVNSNPSTLGRYTDLNLKAGSNITLSYVNNDNLKTTDLTIAATGGGGTSRSISTVAVSSVIAAPASTDIVIIANQGVQLTMPTAVANTNLYTIKNTSTSSVLVSTTVGQTIDSDANGVILNVQYTSIDLISDNANWQIT